MKEKITNKNFDEGFSVIFGVIGIIFVSMFLYQGLFPEILRLPNPKNLSQSIFSFERNQDLSAFESNVDEKDIPLLISGYVNRNGYHPSHICRYGIYLTSRYLNDPNEEDLITIRNVMDWIEENKITKWEYITWYLNEDLEAYNLKAPWTSSMTNAFCAGALLQGSVVLQDQALEIDAKKAIDYLFIPVSRGGGLYTFDNGDIWFEEAPSVDNPSHILNGCIFAVDIMDMFRSYYKTDKYEDHYSKIVNSIRNRVEKYDTGYGSIYDLLFEGNELGNKYHRIHFTQLYYLYLSTEDEYFRDLSRKWYELYKQSEYDVISATSTVSDPLHSVEMLNDEKYWYRYWQAKLPADLVIQFDDVETIKAINFFGLSGSAPTDGLDIYYIDDDGDYVLLEDNGYSIEYKGLNLSNDNRTNVYVLWLDSEVKTGGFKFIFNDVEDRGYIWLRELGFWKDMDDEYLDFMSNYEYFTKIIEKRNND